jgi:hypothetical protein
MSETTRHAIDKITAAHCQAKGRIPDGAVPDVLGKAMQEQAKAVHNAVRETAPTAAEMKMRAETLKVVDRHIAVRNKGIASEFGVSESAIPPGPQFPTSERQ